MFKENTLFVIGAGASAEFGLPIGRQLSDIIKNNSRFRFDFGRLAEGNHDIYDWIRRKYNNNDDVNHRLRALANISKGIFMASSIDNYIDTHSNEEFIAEVGKLQIAVAIADAERRSKLFFETNTPNSILDLSNLSNTWIDSFARILIEKIKREDVDAVGSNVNIICFNYDRCIENYLIEVLRQTFIGIDYGEAYRIVIGMNIIHPYGSLGQLPAALGNASNGEVAFGSTVGGGLDPWPVSERIKTYTEQIEDETMLETIRSAVQSAQQVVFLGFAFHPQNMELLRLSEPEGFKKVYCTGRGISPQEIPEVTGRIGSLYGGGALDSRWRDNVHIEQGSSCSELFAMHWRNLSAA